MIRDRIEHTIQVMQEVYIHLFPTIQNEIINLIENINYAKQDQKKDQNYF